MCLDVVDGLYSFKYNFSVNVAMGLKASVLQVN